MAKFEKVALVTGGGTRVGKAFALALAELGYAVAVHYNSSSEGAEDTVETIRAAGGRANVFKCDFLNGDVSRLIDTVVEQMGRIDLLLNSASTYAPGTIQETSLETLQTQFQVNLFTPFLLSKRFSQLATHNGSERQPALLINVLDNKIAYNQYPYSAYLLSKKAFSEFNAMATLEFAPNIRVNAIAPGVILPASQRTNDYIRWREDGIPLKHQGSTDNLIQALQYIINNNFVCGQTLTVDGGESINIVGRHSENYANNA